MVPSDRTNGKGHKLKYRRSCLNTLSVTVAEHWPRLPKDIVESPFLEILKNYLDVVLGRQLLVALLEQCVDEMNSRGPLQP